METKSTYKLYELSDRIEELESIIDSFEEVQLPEEARKIYEELLKDADQTKADFTDKVDSILSLIQSRKRWLEVRKAEVERLQKLIKKDENTINFLTEYLLKHLEKLEITKLRTNNFNLSVKTASIAPFKLLIEDAKKYPQQYQRVTVEVDKKALKEAVKNGDTEALKYAEFGEKSTYLSIK
ncbi:siphovirus Gp157 family protein [Geminocystis sp. NIES-3709]|uniref:siphovirus Gp157 family protein n=1 Tax=Geminocystis sp. NIES-3709 TaxID=1617448 RepID=UPI0005FC59BE|nr:siphovirus Gp157 family protein [Geminocystis sp. NIES-3709]BAQ63951.1 phage protein [Geminocystis sp. NIES-3709]